jgi:hypothetical protein
MSLMRGRKGMKKGKLKRSLAGREPGTSEKIPE